MSARVVKDGLFMDLLPAEITVRAALDMISSPRGLHRRNGLEFRRLQDRQIGRMLIQHSWNEDTPFDARVLAASYRPQR